MDLGVALPVKPRTWKSIVTTLPSVTVIGAPLALCQSDHLPLSEPASAIKDILTELIAGIL